MDIEKTYANYLDADGINAIQALEKESNTLIMAYTTPFVPASVPPETLEKIKALEEKLCVRLVAYQGH